MIDYLMYCVEKIQNIFSQINYFKNLNFEFEVEINRNKKSSARACRNQMFLMNGALITELYIWTAILS